MLAIGMCGSGEDTDCVIISRWLKKAGFRLARIPQNQLDGNTTKQRNIACNTFVRSRHKELGEGIFVFWNKNSMLHYLTPPTNSDSNGMLSKGGGVERKGIFHLSLNSLTPKTASPVRRPEQNNYSVLGETTKTRREKI